MQASEVTPLSCSAAQASLLSGVCSGISNNARIMHLMQTYLHADMQVKFAAECSMLTPEADGHVERSRRQPARKDT